MFKETIEEHRKSFNADIMRDLIDLYLLEMETRRFQTNSSFQGMQHSKSLDYEFTSEHWKWYILYQKISFETDSNILIAGFIVF